MDHRLFQLLVVNLGIAVIYAIQKKIAWRLANWVEDEILESRYEREREFRGRPYPAPRHKNLYLRSPSELE